MWLDTVTVCAISLRKKISRHKRELPPLNFIQNKKKDLLIKEKNEILDMFNTIGLKKSKQKTSVKLRVCLSKIIQTTVLENVFLICVDEVLSYVEIIDLQSDICQ